MVDANTTPVINSLSVTKNGTYTAPEGVDGYSPITVDVQEQSWQPLQDGYSNFWFELTNDTLSPWLNFSAKNANAVIDWGDGSGEVALGTLTPTHTYSKAGRYVVKVKGVTGIARQFNTPVADSDVAKYMHSLTAVELNQDVQTTSNYMFFSCFNLKNVDLTQTDLTAIAFASFQYCTGLVNLKFPTNLEIIGGQLCIYNSIYEVILPSTVTEINTSAFLSCLGLGEIHIAATAPPALGSTVFSNLPSNFIIYVPIGTGDTYKAAAGWSTYADHILEEGQTRSRAMLSKSEDTLTDEPNTPEER